MAIVSNLINGDIMFFYVILPISAIGSYWLFWLWYGGTATHKNEVARLAAREAHIEKMEENRKQRDRRRLANEMEAIAELRKSRF